MKILLLVVIYIITRTINVQWKGNSIFSNLGGGVFPSTFSYIKGTVHSSNIWAKSIAHGSLMIVS